MTEATYVILGIVFGGGGCGVAAVAYSYRKKVVKLTQSQRDRLIDQADAQRDRMIESAKDQDELDETQSWYENRIREIKEG